MGRTNHRSYIDNTFGNRHARINAERKALVKRGYYPVELVREILSGLAPEDGGIELEPLRTRIGVLRKQDLKVSSVGIGGNHIIYIDDEGLVTVLAEYRRMRKIEPYTQERLSEIIAGRRKPYLS